jgi:hypothetical protein
MGQHLCTIINAFEIYGRQENPNPCRKAKDFTAFARETAATGIWTPSN